MIGIAAILAWVAVLVLVFWLFWLNRPHYAATAAYRQAEDRWSLARDLVMYPIGFAPFIVFYTLGIRRTLKRKASPVASATKSN